MARIAERERARARRRAIIGVGALVLAAAVPLLAFGTVTASAALMLLSSPQALLYGLVALAPYLRLIGTVVEAVWVGAGTLVAEGSLQLLVYALMVCALTFIWARIVVAPLQWSPHTLRVGESK